MSFFTTSDGVRLFHEETGRGHPIVFVHEFAGDSRSYEAQIRHFSRRYRCVVYNARGYPPSEAPALAAGYSQDKARDDLIGLIEHLGLGRAHVVGVSMGGFAALHAAIARPDLLSAIVVAGSGYGAYPPTRDKFRADMEATAAAFAAEGAEGPGRRYAAGPTRLQFARKDSRGYAEFVAQFLEHPARTSTDTLRGVQRDRPSLWDLRAELASIRVPTLIMSGDEDEGCLEPALFLKRTIPTAGLSILPNTGHTLNLEEPAAFNAALADFFHQAESGVWPVRDPRTRPAEPSSHTI